jgi:uncharacterized DUF497 family protein
MLFRNSRCSYKCSNINQAWSSNGIRGKARSNERKHAITFEFATGVFEDIDRTERLDNSSAEERWATVGLVEGVEIYVVYTVRDEAVRLITARRATRNEREEYWNR